jgi:hypothetical protein
MDLSFYNNRKNTQFRPDLLGFLDAEGRFPSGDRDSILLEQLFGLILMNFHFSPRYPGTTSSCADRISPTRALVQNLL